MPDQTTEFPRTGFVRLSSILHPRGPIPVSKSTWWAGVKDGRFPQAAEAWPARAGVARRRHSRADGDRSGIKVARPAWRRVKLHRSYTVDEAARTLGVCKGTVRRWIKARDLPALTDRKPVLILGGDLIDLGKARKRAKQTCAPGELYCVAKRSIFQDGRTVRTKNRKTFTSWFFPVGDDVERIATDWIAYLAAEKLFGPADPLFPATRVALGESGKFEVVGLDRKPWSNTQAIRKVFRTAFERAGLPYFHPHSFRRTLARLGEQVCRTPEEFKAWSQNLGHEQVLTTFTSYGAVAVERQGAILEDLRERVCPPENDEAGGAGLDSATIQRVLKHLADQGAGAF